MFKNVLLAIDLDEEASWRKALPAALETCRAESAALHVLNVAPEVNAQISSFFPADSNRKLLEATRAALREFVTRHVPAGIAAREIVAQGTIYEEILAVAQRIGADLIVMGARAPGVRDILLGANAAHVVRHAKCSVLVVREGP